MTRRNTMRLWIFAGILVATAGGFRPANSTAFQLDGPFPSRLEDALQSPGAVTRLQSNQRSGTVYHTSRLPAGESSTKEHVDDLSWFGTVMSFPAERETGNVSRLDNREQHRPSQTSSTIDPKSVPTWGGLPLRSTAPFQFASSVIPAKGQPVANALRVQPGTNPTSLIPTTVNPTASRSVLTTNSILETSLSGSQFLTLDSEGNFQIEVKNSSEYLANDIIVQLTVPTGLMICNLDRQAWLDEQARTVSWKIASLPPSGSEKIQYRVKSLNRGIQKQKIAVGMNNQFQSIVEHQTEITIGDK